MTAALIVLLAQDGKLKFSDPVSSYVPNVPNGENITVAQLLKMRSGLYGYTADPALAAAMDADPGKAWTPQEVLDIAFRHPPQFAPDASYEYSNTNYALLGLIAEKAGGRPLAEQLHDRLFGPVGLTQTSLPAADDTSMPAPLLARLHVRRQLLRTRRRPVSRRDAGRRTGRNACNRSITPTKTPPTPPPPAARSPRPMTWPRG